MSTGGLGAIAAPTLGLRQDLAQLSLLVLVNVFVGGMVGIERSILPALAQEEFHLAERAAILSFIAVFGITKAAANYFAGRFSDQWGRKPVLIVGWLIAIPTPFLIMYARSWGWVVAANVFLGASQGLTWSTAVACRGEGRGCDWRSGADSKAQTCAYNFGLCLATRNHYFKTDAWRDLSAQVRRRTQADGHNTGANTMANASKLGAGTMVVILMLAVAGCSGGGQGDGGGNGAGGGQGKGGGQGRNKGQVEQQGPGTANTAADQAGEPQQ